jgi:hypothetical protein
MHADTAHNAAANGQKAMIYFRLEKPSTAKPTAAVSPAISSGTRSALKESLFTG